MKSLHYWFLVSCGTKGVKSSLRFISNLFCLIGRKIASHHFLLFFGLIGEYQVYQEYQEFTKNTRNTHEIASLLVSCGNLNQTKSYFFSLLSILRTNMTSLNFKFLVLYLFLPRLIGRKIIFITIVKEKNRKNGTSWFYLI